MHGIYRSVGKNGTNVPHDVGYIQMLLNRRCREFAPHLKVDGVAGPKTVLAIMEFQKTWVMMKQPDGVIEPFGPTYSILSSAPHGPALSPKNAAPPSNSASLNNGTKVLQIAWGAQVSKAFKEKVIRISTDLAVSPDYLMAAMAFESGESFKSDVKNAAGSGAVGLIQFMPSTAKGLGTTTEKLSAMSNVEQLDYVKKYFQAYSAKKLLTIEDIYMAILYPKAIGEGSDYVLFEKGTGKKPTKAYSQNSGLDKDNDGKITVQEAAAKVRAKLKKGLKLGNFG